jgi:ABC-2 type transport system ATP-binding protein
MTPDAPLVTLRGVHARDASGSFRRARGGLHGLTLDLGPGVFAFVGAPEDGTIALAETIAGVRAPLRGQIAVGGQAPARAPSVRARIGALLPEPALPEARSVGAAVTIARRARGETSARPEELLEPLGLGHLAPRDPLSLGFAEARAVELALALSTPNPLLVALHEPLADVAINLLGLVRERIRDLALAGACVVVTTSSPADARALGDRILLLHKGSIAGEGDAAGPLLGGEAVLRAWIRPLEGPGDAASVRALARILSERSEVRAVAWEERAGPPPRAAEVRVTGDDLDACALALVDAAVEAGVFIESIAPASPGIGQVRAATEALQAFRRTATLSHRSPGALPPGRSPRQGIFARPAPPAMPPAPAPAPSASPSDAVPPPAPEAPEPPRESDPHEPGGGGT